MFSKQFLIASGLLALQLVKADDSSCAGIQVLDACVQSTTAIVQNCATTDYNCLCAKWGDVVTCYNECPNDTDVSSAQANKAAYCNDAQVYKSSTTSLISATASTGTGTGGATATALTGGSSSQTGSSALTTITGTSSTMSMSMSMSSSATGDSQSTKASSTFGSGTTSTKSSASSTASADKKNGAGVVGVEGLGLAVVVGLAGVMF